MNNTLRLTKLTSDYFMGCLRAEGGIQFSVCRNTSFLEPNAVPKLLDDQMHTMVLQIIS